MSTIVMTGGTSGFGADAARRMASAGTRLILGARRPGTLGEQIPLDLAELASVRAFATTVRARLGGSPIDALVLNAGVIMADAASRTTDGYETTFAVNHLAPYLLLRELHPTLAAQGVVVLTTSGTHDPATHAGLAPPRHADAELLARPDLDTDLDPRPQKAGQHAYTASKLCVLLTALALSEQPEVRDRGITVIAYCPGQVFGTGLARSLSSPMRIGWSVLGSPLGWPLRRLDPQRNTRKAAARTLADLALRTTTSFTGRLYAALRAGRLTWPEPSDLARDHAIAQRLWADSARLTALQKSSR